MVRCHRNTRNTSNLTAQALPELPPARTAKFRGSAHPNFAKVKRLVKKLAPQYELNPDLLLAVIAAESNFNPRALSHKNAKGLMQTDPANGGPLWCQEHLGPRTKPARGDGLSALVTRLFQ